MGPAAALALARDGAIVILAGRGEDKLAAVKNEIEAAGGRAEIKPADVSRREDDEALVAFAEARFDRLNFAFNNAGVFTPTGN
jgi:NAD(P)-dependent dehydrogenase (short-subunit alcohol dehydrogenase family)